MAGTCRPIGENTSVLGSVDDAELLPLGEAEPPPEDDEPHAARSSAAAPTWATPDQVRVRD
jgi:hypothetical protein